MPGVEDAGRLRDEIDADELTGHEPHLGLGVGEQRLMRAVRLLDQARAAPARVPQGSHDERRQQRRPDGVAHRIGHRHMQRVAIQ